MRVFVNAVKLIAFALVACSQVFGVVRGYECHCAGGPKPVSSSECVVTECHDGRPHEDGCREERAACGHAGDCGDEHPQDQSAHDGVPCPSGEDSQPCHSHKHEHSEVRDSLKARGASAAEWQVAPPAAPSVELPDFLVPDDPILRLAALRSAVMDLYRMERAHAPPGPSIPCLVARSIVLLV